MSPGPWASPVGLYVHVPFCARACPYCDFDFEVGRDPPVDRFIAGLERERRARRVPEGLPVHTVYVGGGTPSMLGPAGLGALWEWIGDRFDTTACVERTTELNPEHVDERLLEALASRGVRRVSLGVQSLSTDALSMLGRVHRAAKARQALGSVLRRGLHVSADLIVGWPGQTEASLLADLDGVLAEGVGHVSIYALTIEPGTPWETLERQGRRRRPDADEQAERLATAARRLTAAGFVHYEVASYGRGEHRAEHNLGYWSWRNYLGLGPSAASARYHPDGSVERRSNARGLDRWAADPMAGDEERLAPRAAAAEGLWLGLRRLEGIEVRDFLRRFGAAVDEAWLRRTLDRSIVRGNVQWTDGLLRVHPDRWLWHDEIGADLMSAR